MRAGLATLQKIERVSAYKILEEKTRGFCDDLNEGLARLGSPFQVARTASIFWLHTKSDEVIRRIDQIPLSHSTGFSKVFHGALARGVYLAPSGFEVSFMSFAHDDELLDKAREAIIAAISI
jgi:glutamate-1-semialdehyde 2,1-aminomutase